MRVNLNYIPRIVDTSFKNAVRGKNCKINIWFLQFTSVVSQMMREEYKTFCMKFGLKNGT